MLGARVLRVRFSFEEEQGRVLELMEKYSDTPMSYADACLVRMTEQRSDASIVTLDRDDYGLCAMSGGVWEWCTDQYDALFYRESPESEPLRSVEGERPQ